MPDGTPFDILKPLVDVEKLTFDTLITKPASALGAAPPPRLPGPMESLSNILSGTPTAFPSFFPFQQFPLFPFGAKKETSAQEQQQQAQQQKQQTAHIVTQQGDPNRKKSYGV